MSSSLKRTLSITSWLLPSLIVVLFASHALAGSWEHSFFSGTQYPLKVVFLKGDQPGPTIMVQGGIQGDEAAGYITAQLLTQARVLKGNLIVLPRANVPSINLRKRQINVDMNRRFDQNYNRFYEDRVARVIRFLLAQSDAFIHLHEGSGFYNPTYVDNLRWASAQAGACGREVLIEPINPRDMPGFIKEWSKYPISVATGVNTLFNGLMNHPDFAKLDFSTMKLSLGGGMAVQAPVAERWKKVTKSPLLQAYGLTETSPAATINPPNLKEFNGSIGLPISSTEVSIRGDDGKEVPLDQVGEICVRGPQVMVGYWQRPEETANVMYADGFLRTGDMGYIDHLVYVYLVDRKKDMILVSGFNVYPNEVEEAVAMHEGVSDVAAIGIPDENSGEVVKIFVVRKDPNLTAEELIAHCRKQLTGYKVPKQV